MPVRLPPEAEISILGPGYGECVLVCLAPDNWLVVDSCIHPDFEDPQPLVYLRNLGLDPAKVVRTIVFSHWHDDHIGGAGALVASCPSATVVLSMMVQNREVTQLVAAYAEHSKANMAITGVSEMAKVFNGLSARPAPFCSPKWAVASRSVLKMTAPWPVEVVALSPSDAGITKALLTLGNLLQPGQPKTCVPNISPNSTSVVLWVKIGRHVLLLGGDLEHDADTSMGWTAILGDVERPCENAVAFKVPHHGSLSGYHEEIWTTMLHPQPIALIAPFCRGRHAIPSRQEADTILKHTSQAFLTANPSALSTKQLRRDSTVERSIRETALQIGSMPFSKGQVRVRFDPQSEFAPKVELLNGAIRLQDAHA